MYVEACLYVVSHKGVGHETLKRDACLLQPPCPFSLFFLLSFLSLLPLSSKLPCFRWTTTPPSKGLPPSCCSKLRRLSSPRRRRAPFQRTILSRKFPTSEGCVRKLPARVSRIYLSVRAAEGQKKRSGARAAGGRLPPEGCSRTRR